MDNKNGVCIAIGNFDGIHKGHDILIKKMIQIGHERNLNTVILTFKYSDSSMRKSANNMKYLMSFDNKIKMLEKYQCTAVEVLELNSQISKYSPTQFIEEILINKYNAKHIVVGYNFRFGYKAGGNVETLRELSKELGYNITVIDKVISQYGEGINSTSIRELIKEGNISKANELLSDNFRFFENDVKFVDSTTCEINNSEVLVPCDGTYCVNVAGEQANMTISNSLENSILKFDKNIKKADIIFK